MLRVVDVLPVALMLVDIFFTVLFPSTQEGSR